MSIRSWAKFVTGPEPLCGVGRSPSAARGYSVVEQEVNFHSKAMGGWIRKAPAEGKGLALSLTHAFLHSFTRQGSTLARSAVVSTTVNEDPVEATPRVLWLTRIPSRQR